MKQEVTLLEELPLQSHVMTRNQLVGKQDIRIIDGSLSSATTNLDSLRRELSHHIVRLEDITGGPGHLWKEVLASKP